MIYNIYSNKSLDNSHKNDKLANKFRTIINCTTITNMCVINIVYTSYLGCCCTNSITRFKHTQRARRHSCGLRAQHIFYQMNAKLLTYLPKVCAPPRSHFYVNSVMICVRCSSRVQWKCASARAQTTVGLVVAISLKNIQTFVMSCFE